MAEETVVLVHGLWMNGMEMGLLRRRLQRAGYLTRRFSYSSTASTLVENAMDLNRFVHSIDSPVIHFVCHSLGGLVVRHLFHEYPDQKPGRIVTLGTPHQPSSAARQLSRFFPSRILLGKSLKQGLLGQTPPWRGPRDLGSIAGKLRFGMGMFIPNIPRPSDGTVAVAETRLEGAADHIVLPASHFGLLFSKSVLDQTVHFLRQGRFNHP